MSPWRTLVLVARRDLVERIRSRAFQIATAFTILLVLVAIILPQFLDNGPTQWKVGVVGGDAAEIAATIEALQAVDDPVATTAERLGSRSEAVERLEAGDINVAVIQGEGVLVNDATPRSLATLASAALTARGITDRARQLGLDPAQVAQLLGVERSPINSIEDLGGAVGGDGREALALITTILLFVSIVTYGQWILIGVIEEKSNRVVEVVVGIVPPRLLLAGKVAGIGLLGLIQLMVVGFVAFVALKLTGSVTLPETTGPALAATAFWFLLGFAFYATAYAAAGSLVSRQEEAQNAAFPLTLLLMSAYFIATFSLNADNAVIKLASLLPPFAPMTMPLRIALDRAEAWEVVVSSLLMIVAVFVLLRVAARIYRGGILRAGGRIRINEAWRSSNG